MQLSPKVSAHVMRTKGKLSVDFVGIALTAVGFGCLEVMLDKGQREDWASGLR